MKTFKSALLAAAVVASASAYAVESVSTVFTATDNEIDFAEFIAPTVNISLPSGSSLYLFDATTEVLSTTSGLKVDTGSDASWDIGSQTLTTSHGTLSLTEGTFVVALEVNGELVKDTGFFTASNNDEGILYFGDDNSVLITDVQEVPVPAAAWLFGSALLGMGGLKCRK